MFEANKLSLTIILSLLSWCVSTIHMHKRYMRLMHKQKRVKDNENFGKRTVVVKIMF